jgi:hypothetical protein
VTPEHLGIGTRDITMFQERGIDCLSHFVNLILIMSTLFLGIEIPNLCNMS